jgi:NaMN:DMB phosphoribosyltransferase
MFNPWSVVNLVFHHLAAEGLHPVLGEAGDPSVPAAALLRALGIAPGQDSAGPGATLIQDELARVRAAMDDRPPPG